MCKISTTLLVTFICISDALVSNSSMLENKVTKCYDEYYRGDNFYKDITETQYKYLVSVGGTMNEEMGFLVHECFANMISPWNAISVAQCNLYRYGKIGIDEKKLYVTFDRQPSNTDDKRYLIELFEPMDADCAFLTLAKKVSFLYYNDLPILQDPSDNYINHMVGWNDLVASYPVEASGQPYIEILVFIANPKMCGGNLEANQFCVKPRLPIHAISWNDSGAPLINGKEVVGIIIKNVKNYAIAERVFHSQIQWRIGSIQVKRSSMPGPSTKNKKQRTRWD